jgi:serine/threonine protein kinase
MVKLCDYGLATRTTNYEHLYYRCGTPGYVAPEILKWEKGDPFYNCKSDVFSIGVILFTMITGRMPFEGDFKTTLKSNRVCMPDYT